MQAGTLIQNYRLVKFLGDGGMGQVWLAEHVLLGRRVAIKGLHPQFARNAGIRARFKQEASTLAHLQHPNIVALHDYIEDGEAAFLVMEYVDGMQLDELISRKTGPIPTPQLKQLFGQILDGFIYAHGKNVVHRDIKPGNILVTADGTVKILDFGIAKILTEGNPKLTKTGANLGTVLYMSPEQVKGEAVDVRSDIYSLGVTLFQMATGNCPYSEDVTEFFVYDQIVNRELPPASQIYPGVSRNIEWAIGKATAKRPEDRFSNCTEFLVALRKDTHTETTRSTEVGGKTRGEGLGPVTNVVVDSQRENSSSSPQSRQNNVATTASSRQEPNTKRSNRIAPLIAVFGTLLMVILLWKAFNGKSSGNDHLSSTGIENGETRNDPVSAEGENKKAEEEERKREAERKEKEEEAEKENQKRLIRSDFRYYLTTERSEYTYSSLGGIYDLYIKVNNETDFRMDVVQVNVRYIKANGGIYKVEQLVFNDIPPHSSRQIKAPDSERGTSIDYYIRSVTSAQLDLCFDSDRTYSDTFDPYHCE